MKKILGTWRQSDELSMALRKLKASRRIQGPLGEIRLSDVVQQAQSHRTISAGTAARLENSLKWAAKTVLEQTEIYPLVTCRPVRALPWSHQQCHMAERIEWVLWIVSRGLGSIRDEPGLQALQTLYCLALDCRALHSAQRNISLRDVCETLWREEYKGYPRADIIDAIYRMRQYLNSLIWQFDDSHCNYRDAGLRNGVS